MSNPPELQLVSTYFGNNTSMTLTSDSHVQLRIFLTDKPEPTGYEIYIDGKLAQQSSWNSGIGYEENIPLTGLSAGTYTFQAKVFFNDGTPTITTNTVTLIITSSSTSTSSTSNVQISDAINQTQKLAKLSTDQEIAMGVGFSAVVILGGIGYYFYQRSKR